MFGRQARADFKQRLPILCSQLIKNRPPSGVRQCLEYLTHQLHYRQVFTCMSSHRYLDEPDSEFRLGSQRRSPSDTEFRPGVLGGSSSVFTLPIQKPRASVKTEACGARAGRPIQRRLQNPSLLSVSASVGCTASWTKCAERRFQVGQKQEILNTTDGQKHGRGGRIRTLGPRFWSFRPASYQRR